MTNIFNLLEHIISVVSYELKTADLFNILFVGVIEFAVFYFFSKFAKNIILKTFIFAFALYTLFGTIQDNTILTEPLVFATFGLIAPHFNIFSLWIRYIRKMFTTLKTLFLSFLYYILTPFRYLKLIFEKMTSFFNKRQQSKKENYKEEKTYKDYFDNNSQEYKSYEKQKEEYFKNKEKQKRQDEQDKKQQKERQKEKQQKQNNYKQKTHQKNQEQKTYSRWDSPNAYEVLGLKNNATKKEIKKAFRDLAKIYHPDLTQDKKEEYKLIFQKINNAYNILKL